MDTLRDIFARNRAALSGIPLAVRQAARLPAITVVDTENVPRRRKDMPPTDPGSHYSPPDVVEKASSRHPEYKAYEHALQAQIEQLRNLIAVKHHNYGPALKRRGYMGIITRIEDKLQRWENLMDRSPTPSTIDFIGESIDDTLLDIAGYAVQALMMRKGYYDLPLAITLDHDLPRKESPAANS